MPCYVTGSRAGDLELDIKEMRKELLRATRAACELAKAYNNFSQWDDFRGMSKATQEWIREHNLIDKRRKTK